MRVNILYDGEEVGAIITNHSLDLDRVLRLAGIDINEMLDESTPKWDYELFTMDYQNG